MNFRSKRIPSAELTALKFTDEETFRSAVRLAVDRDIPADAPGYFTLIIRKTDKKLFKSLAYKEQRVADPEKVSSKEVSRLRRYKDPNQKQ